MIAEVWEGMLPFIRKVIQNILTASILGELPLGILTPGKKIVQK